MLTWIPDDPNWSVKEARLHNGWLPFETPFLLWNDPIPLFKKSLYTANLNSCRTFKITKTFDYCFIHCLFKHFIAIDYQLFLSRITEGTMVIVWDENVFIFNWPPITEMSLTAYDYNNNLFGKLVVRQLIYVSLSFSLCIHQLLV